MIGIYRELFWLSGDCEYTPRPPAVMAVLQRRAFEKLHGDEGFPVLLTDAGKCSDLGAKAGQRHLRVN